MIGQTLFASSNSKNIDTQNFKDSTSILASGDNLVPFFWLGLFSEEDIHFREIDTGYSDLVRFPNLVVPSQTGKDNMRKRKELILRLVTVKYAHLYKQWEKLVNNNLAAYLHIELPSPVGQERDVALYFSSLKSLISQMDSLRFKNSVHLLEELFSLVVKKTIFGSKIASPLSESECTMSLCGRCWIKEQPWQDYWSSPK